MLPKKFRLKASEFYNNPQRPIKFISGFFLLLFKKNQVQNPRFYINVPKSLDKRSVYRHKTRRIVIEAIRKHLNKLTIRADIFIKMRKTLDQANKDLFYREIERIFQHEKFHSFFDKGL